MLDSRERKPANGSNGSSENSWIWALLDRIDRLTDTLHSLDIRLGEVIWRTDHHESRLEHIDRTVSGLELRWRLLAAVALFTAGATGLVEGRQVAELLVEFLLSARLIGSND